jgi:hypothetical protein
MLAISLKRESGMMDDVFVGLAQSQIIASRPLFDEFAL